METGREQEAEHGLGAACARGRSPKSTTGTPVTASGCKQVHCAAAAGKAGFLTRKGPVNQGGTTKSFKGCRPCFVARMAAFFSFLPALAVHLILIEGAQDAYV